MGKNNNFDDLRGSFEDRAMPEIEGADTIRKLFEAVGEGGEITLFFYRRRCCVADGRRSNYFIELDSDYSFSGTWKQWLDWCVEYAGEPDDESFEWLRRQGYHVLPGEQWLDIDAKLDYCKPRGGYIFYDDYQDGMCHCDCYDDECVEMDDRDMKQISPGVYLNDEYYFYGTMHEFLGED